MRARSRLLRWSDVVVVVVVVDVALMGVETTGAMNPVFCVDEEFRMDAGGTINRDDD